MAKTLLQSIDEKRVDISRMQESLAFLEKGSEFPVDRSRMPVLGKLEAMLNAASSEAERSQRLQMAREALLEAEQELRQLESEISSLEAIEQKSIRDLDRAIAKFNQLGQEQAEIASQIEKICQDSGSAISRLRGRALYCPIAPKSATVGRFGNQILFE